MIDWVKVPWTLWVYAVFSVGQTVQLLFGVKSTPALALVFFAAVMLGWVYVLFRGIRWVWIATLVVLVLATVDILAFGPRTWWGALSGVVTFVLLLSPPTRRYFAKPVAADT